MKIAIARSLPRSDRRVVLTGVSWEDYETALVEFEKGIRGA